MNRAMRIEDEEREVRERMRELAREQVLRAEAERDATREPKPGEAGEGELEDGEGELEDGEGVDDGA